MQYFYFMARTPWNNKKYFQILHYWRAFVSVMYKIYIVLRKKKFDSIFCIALWLKKIIVKSYRKHSFCNKSYLSITDVCVKWNYVAFTKINIIYNHNWWKSSNEKHHLNSSTTPMMSLCMLILDVFLSSKSNFHG